MPSPSALRRMLEEAGVGEVETRWHPGTRRVYGHGKKLSQVGTRPCHILTSTDISDGLKHSIPPVELD